MAKFRKVRRYARKAFGKARRHSKSSSESPLEMGLYSAGYGVVRQKAADFIPDVPMLQGYSDNIILGGIGYLAAKKGSGMIKKAGKAVLMNESFIAGAKAGQGFMGSSSNSQSGVTLY